ncbi:TipAS antibiotic-recognition domain-containing protein [Blautia sp.]|nr:TipAS antibiotic-recognition domain-containing protein [Blautia sp.]MEE0810360.1 TipAS antibiotic-recognition domain-containing protein [Blautia sp.]
MASLGQMYVADKRFKKNIDKYADGTARFVNEAIEVYCHK